MLYETIDFSLKGGVARIVLNRPTSFNALNLQCAKDLFHIANHLGSDRSVRVVLLTGAGTKAFCAGGDVAAFAADPGAVELLLKEMSGYLHMAVARFASMNAPLVAVVNGVAAGLGLSLVACCDLAIASESARFTSAYTQIGLSPDGSSTYYLTRLLGTRRAMELYLTNRTLSAAEALDWGLVNRVVSADSLETSVAEIAGLLASGPTRAYGSIKRLLMTAPSEPLESQLEKEAREIVQLSTSADGLEGVLAFTQKRKPVFKGQ